MPETTSLYWPENITEGGILLGSYSRFTGHETLVERSFTGREQRLAAFPEEGYEGIQFQWGPLLPSEARDFLIFFSKQCRGQKNPFNFFPQEEEDFQDLILGTYQSGGTLIIGAKGVVGLTDVKADGIAVTAGYTLTAGVGPGGEDRINFVTPFPSAGAVITGDFSGRRRYVARWESDRPPRQWLRGGETTPIRWVFECVLKEVR